MRTLQLATLSVLATLCPTWVVDHAPAAEVEVDNNLTENAIRPFVIGRKAWLFADTPAGTDASARLYSLIETAKANGVEPYAYLRHVFKMLPAAKTVEDIEALLPWNAALGDAISVAAIA